MKDIKTILGILFFFTIAGHTDAPPFPQSQLDPILLESFYPQIMSEVEKPFFYQNDGRTHRGTREYGYSFFKMETGDFSYSPPPLFLQQLGAKICEALGDPQQEFTNIILSLYDEGFHLEPHVDTNATDPHKGYYFEENVYGIIIAADATGHLYFVRDDAHLRPPLDLKPIYALEEKPGLIFCLKGTYRKSPFFHGVTKVSNHRISITFRRVVICEESLSAK